MATSGCAELEAVGVHRENPQALKMRTSLKLHKGHGCSFFTARKARVVN